MTCMLMPHNEGAAGRVESKASCELGIVHAKRELFDIFLTQGRRMRRGLNHGARTVAMLLAASRICPGRIEAVLGSAAPGVTASAGSRRKPASGD